MSELLFYKKPVPLNKEQHRHHSIKKFERLDFAATAQSVLITGTEYPDVSKEYPIVFVKTPDNNFMSVALLGFRPNENLYINSAGKWDARYIPAYVRRYPFIFSEADSQQLLLCVDENCDALNITGEGEPLFDENGATSPFMNTIVQFMQDYQLDFQRTRTFLDHLQQLELLKENNVQIKLLSGEEFQINGIWTVDETKLAALSDDKLLQLVKSGELSRIYAHLVSLSNLGYFAVLDAKRAATVKSAG